MKITFVMPPYPPKPVGGYAVIYEYANKLAARGHEVTVVHACPPVKNRPRPLTRLFLRLTGKGQQAGNSILVPEVHWYPIDSRVKMLHVPETTASYIPDGDAIFPIIKQVYQVAEYYPREKGKEFCIFQGYRMMPLPPAREDALWRAPIPKIVIARWLYEQGLKLGVPADEMVHIPNGIDHTRYRIPRPIEDRTARIAMLCHKIAWKGSVDGLEALKIARIKFPTLQAVLFGVLPRPEGLPDWIEYHCDPPQEVLVESIYNGSSIYLCPSWREGWHLPPAEAMACGCAVVSTDIGGVRDYAEHEVTALLSPPKNPEALAANILRLLKDDDLRVRLAIAGYERIQEFTWERSTDLLEQFITDRIG